MQKLIIMFIGFLLLLGCINIDIFPTLIESILNSICYYDIRMNSWKLTKTLTGYTQDEITKHVNPPAETLSMYIVQASFDFCGFDFFGIQFTATYDPILFSSPLVLQSNLNLRSFGFRAACVCPHINSINGGMPVCS